MCLSPPSLTAFLAVPLSPSLDFSSLFSFPCFRAQSLSLSLSLLRLSALIFCLLSCIPAAWPAHCPAGPRLWGNPLTSGQGPATQLGGSWCHPLEEPQGHSISSLWVTWQWYALFPHFCNFQIAPRLGLWTDGHRDPAAAAAQPSLIQVRGGGSQRWLGEEKTCDNVLRRPRLHPSPAPEQRDGSVLKGLFGIFFGSWVSCLERIPRDETCQETQLPTLVI